MLPRVCDSLAAEGSFHAGPVVLEFMDPSHHATDFPTSDVFTLSTVGLPYLCFCFLRLQLCVALSRVIKSCNVPHGT